MLLMLLTFAVLAPAHQQVTPAPDQPMASLRLFHDLNKRNVVAAAEAIPEALYAFRPTADVRSVGQSIAHIADTLYYACSQMRDEPNPIEKNHRPGVVGEDSIERLRTSKAELVDAVTSAFAYCDAPFARSPAGLSRPELVKAFGFHAVLAVYHTADHYGNLVTYMRLKGLVPPSSGGA